MQTNFSETLEYLNNTGSIPDEGDKQAMVIFYFNYKLFVSNIYRNISIASK